MFRTVAYNEHCIRVVNTDHSNNDFYDLADYLISLKDSAIKDVIPTKNELMLCLDQDEILKGELNINELISSFKSRSTTTDNNAILKLKAKINLTPDLEVILTEKKIGLETFIDRLSQSSYNLNMFGFLPGFMYIDGLDQSLQMPRKTTPSNNCEAASLAIGGPYLGVYKYPSPAGWHIIGTITNLPELQTLHKYSRGTNIEIQFDHEVSD